ncbi:MAG: ABC transporter ATP-binding protein [Thermoguttaceae bacterium]|nr:ABC transporter ATP-binding protein [Thermoguttaceae bacterium]
MIQVRNLACRGSGRLILDGLNFAVAKGAYTIISGPNGAGKTTLLRCLDRIIDNWTGEILLDGKSVRVIPRQQLARTIAYVQQTTSFLPFTAKEYVRLARYPFLGRLSFFSSADERIVVEAMETMQVMPFAARSLDSLSGGERQRVFLAAALAQAPGLLLLDEPTAMLDFHQREIIANLLHDLHTKRGVTIIEVTHDLNHAALSGTQVLLLSEGRIVYDGPARDVTSPERLKTIYGADVELVRHPQTDVMMIVPSR